MVPTVPNFLFEEVVNLPESQVLLEQDEYRVFWARASQIPYTLREIGRLREVTFRDAGEGTGSAIDLDGFDPHYHHLILWQKKAREVVGAYRLGPTDLILGNYGKKGLYTNSLFKFHNDFFLQVHPALELGRSFIRKEYQKAYSTLLLLWKGIGQYVVRYPRYRYLFGPVSISDDYRPLSRILLVKFLQQQNYRPELARWVKARHPYRTIIRRDWLDQAVVSLIWDAAEVSDWIAELEADQKGMPILLKQYLKLGGKLLGFNVDPQFSRVVDGLILVDLAHTNPTVLEKYLGKEGADYFLGTIIPRSPRPAMSRLLHRNITILAFRFKSGPPLPLAALPSNHTVTRRRRSKECRLRSLHRSGRPDPGWVDHQTGGRFKGKPPFPEGRRRGLIKAPIVA